MKKLTRSRNDKYIFGVCGGLARYLNIDSTIIRILWFVLTMTSFGIFGVAYIVFGIVIPLESSDGNNYQTETGSNNNTKIFIGLSLIIVGLYMVSNLLFPHFSILLYRMLRFWPVLLIVLGLYVILKKD
ncbi:MAG: PspC domain-containing protein [Gudongella sp.]|jgi:phage shock protein PspC (stress-responsive transcriptional regulator)|nr:PspC domain-containing protein [Gudongella sp.]